MKNSILSTLLVLLATLSVSGCSLFSSDSEETETATVSESEAESGEAASIEEDGAEESSDEYAYDDFEESGGETSSQEEGTLTEETLSVAATDVEVEESFSNDTDVDEYPDDDYDYGSTAGTADLSEDVYQEDSVFVDEGGDIPADTMSSNQEQDLFVREDQEPVVDEPTFADATDYTESVIGSPKWVPVKKIKTSAYQRAGVNVNRVYIVRPGDTMNSVATKTSSNKQDLYNINPHFNNKSLKVGDKVYYGSSRQPNDSSMKTYHEDMNIPPQYYTSQSGDNIRKISKRLLGHDRSWMEIWATNSEVESKDIIMGGLQLRYWPDGVDTQMAQKAEPVLKPVVEEVVEEAAPVEEIPVVEEVAQAPVEESMPEAQEVAQVEEPNPFEEEEMGDMSGDEEFNPPPAAGSIGGNSPPPTAVAPPPPPPPPAPMANKMKPSNPDGPMSVGQDMLSAAKDDQMIMGALGGLLILAAIIMLIFIRRSRSKRVNFSQTQV